MSIKKYESIWIELSDVNLIFSDEAIINNCKIYYRKSFDIIFILINISFTTLENLEGDIIINLPQLEYSFIQCENTVLASKFIKSENTHTKTLTHIKLSNKELNIEGFPLEKNCDYSLNFQCFSKILI